MLSLDPQQGKLRRTNNLLPTETGGMASRPSAQQLVAGDITGAAPWGNRALLEKLGRLVLWDGSETDIAPAGRIVQATAFQAPTSDAQREDRLYVADGINPLWYIARRSGVYGKYGILNSVKDASGVPYAIPVAFDVANYRERVWVALGSNRVQHCQAKDPDMWDPLWTVECQGEKSDRVLSLETHGKTLAAGLRQSVWLIAGDSHLNWTRDPIATVGVAGPNAMTSDDNSLYWISSVGVHVGDSAEPLSGDIKKAFNVAAYPAEIVMDHRRRLLLCLVAGRLFVMHMAKPGQFGEITGHNVRGLIQLDDYVGWYGANGLWVLSARDMPDRYLNGTASEFTSLYDTWENIPNAVNGGRALMTRANLVVSGSTRADMTYTVTAADSEKIETKTEAVKLSDFPAQVWTDQIAGLDGEEWPTPPVTREVPMYVAGTRFRHQLSAPCYMEIHHFEPGYKFGDDEE